MILLKTDEEIEILKECNNLVTKTIAEIAKILRPGITTDELDRYAENFIRSNGAIPSFLNYKGYPKSICTSINDQVVHGIPSDYVIKDGDVVSIDCGVYYKGYHGDSAYTFVIGSASEEVKKLIKVTYESLFKGIEAAKAGNRIGDIGFAIQSYCETHGLSVVREMVGHGIGKNLHEAPEVPNYGKRGTGVKLRAGMVFCIEPMINLGKKEIVIEKDGWTVRTLDRKPSAHFELPVAIKEKNTEILTNFAEIEKNINENKYINNILNG